MNDTQPLAKIESILLPWMVSTSVSNFQMTVTENGNSQLLVDTFWGHHSEQHQYRRVAVQFEGVAAAYYGAFRNDNEQGGRESFDWSNVFTKPQNAEELQSWLESDADEWESTGMCPDSNFYRVIGSRWVEDYFGQPQHFLLRGCDGFVEMLALDFSWFEVGPLES